MTGELIKTGAKLMGGVRNNRNERKSYFRWGLGEATQLLVYLALGFVAFGLLVDFVEKEFGRTPKTR